MIALRSPFRWLPNLTLLILLLLFLAPATGWLVGAQFRTLFRPMPGVNETMKNGNFKEGVFDLGDDFEWERANRQVQADKSPDDYLIQLATAGDTSSSTKAGTVAEVGARYHHLAVQFPNHPAIYAHWLRRLASMEFVHRNESYLLEGQKPSDYEWRNPTPTAWLTQCDDVAAAGEKADPNNAYFPLLRAHALFGMHQDERAMAALERASWKPDWNDFFLEEEQAGLRLKENTFGTPGYLDRLLVWIGTRQPDYGSLRMCAWVATYKAVVAEHAGRYQEGLAIRECLMRCGHNMRVHSPGIVGVRFGIVITEIATKRPGGIPYVDDRGPLTWASQKVARNQEYVAYLLRHGWTGSAAWAKGELEVDDGILALELDAVTRSPIGVQTAESIIAWWVGGMELLANAICLLWVAGIMMLRWPRRWYARAFAVLIALGVPALFLCLRPWLANLTNIFVMVECWGGSYEQGWLMLPTDTSVQGFNVLISLLIPLLLLCCLCIRAWRRHEPVWDSITAALRTVTPTLTCILLILYSGALIRTVQLDTDASQQFDAMLPTEARFMFNNIGETWPDPRYRDEVLHYESPGTFH